MTDEVRNRPGQEPRVPPEPPDPATLRFSEVEAMGYRAGFEEGEAQRDRLRAALRDSGFMNHLWMPEDGHNRIGGERFGFETCKHFRCKAVRAALSDPTPSPVEHGWETRHRVHPAQTDWVVLPQKSEAECLHWIDAWDDGGVVTEAEAVRVERTVVHHWKRTPEAPDGN